MTDMIERVARAICAAETGGRPAGYMADGSPMREPTWDWYEAYQHDEWRRLARAALGAMREPSDEMVGLGDDMTDAGAKVSEVFTAMIAAALSDGAKRPTVASDDIPGTTKTKDQP